MSIPNTDKNTKLIGDFLRAFDPPAISFDGCHKIYILLDDEQAKQSEEWGYGEDGSFLIYTKDMSREDMISTLINWYNESCSLRFINAVRTVSGNPNDGYITVIGQSQPLRYVLRNEDDE